MTRNPIVIIDSDAIIARANSDDAHNEKTLKIMQYLEKVHAKVFYPSTTIVEAVTHIQRALNNGATAFQTASLLINTEAKIIQVDDALLKLSMRFFSKTTSKKNTLFDCVVLAIAKEKKADAIFSFDKFYTRHGFKLAEDLLV